MNLPSGCVTPPQQCDPLTRGGGRMPLAAASLELTYPATTPNLHLRQRTGDHGAARTAQKASGFLSFCSGCRIGGRSAEFMDWQVAQAATSHLNSARFIATLPALDSLRRRFLTGGWLWRAFRRFFPSLPFLSSAPPRSGPLAITRVWTDGELRICVGKGEGQ